MCRTEDSAIEVWNSTIDVQRERDSIFEKLLFLYHVLFCSCFLCYPTTGTHNLDFHGWREKSGRLFPLEGELNES